MELQHCPFCGALSAWIMQGKVQNFVLCKACRAYGPVGKDTAEAITLWNQRQPLWIPVGEEKPDAMCTVLLCNLVWDEPVITGYTNGEDWFDLDDRELNGMDGCGDPYAAFNPPTHWMHLPEPPGVAQVPDIPAPAPVQTYVPSGPPVSPFRHYEPHSPLGYTETCDSQDRIAIVKKCTREQCAAILSLYPGSELQKTVRKAVEVRLRQLEKETSR